MYSPCRSCQLRAEDLRRACLAWLQVLLCRSGAHLQDEIRIRLCGGQPFCESWATTVTSFSDGGERRHEDVINGVLWSKRGREENVALGGERWHEDVIIGVLGGERRHDAKRSRKWHTTRRWTTPVKAFYGERRHEVHRPDQLWLWHVNRREFLSSAIERNQWLDVLLNLFEFQNPKCEIRRALARRRTLPPFEIVTTLHYLRACLCCVSHNPSTYE